MHIMTLNDIFGIPEIISEVRALKFETVGPFTGSLDSSDTGFTKFWYLYFVTIFKNFT